MTGLELAQRAGCRIAIVDGMDAMGACYAWRQRVIVLPRCVADGSDVASLAIAAHEACHHQQPLWLHRLSFITAVKWYLEVDAWRRAMVMLQKESGQPG